MSASRDSACEEHAEYVKLVFFGSPLLDITTDCLPSLLGEYSLKSDDCILADETHESLFEELFRNPKSRLDAGGSALNSARIAKWALGEKGRVAFAGCVGMDKYETWLSEELESCDVESLFVRLPESNTGVCACLLTPGGQRSMCTRLGAAALFAKDHLEREDISRRLHTADCVFVVGYFLSHSPEVVFDLADGCTQNGQMFALSLSAEYICRDFKEALLKVLPKVDILLGNEAEINTFAAAVGIATTSTIDETASAVANLGRTRSVPRIVIVTRGPEPVVIVRGDEPPRLFPVPRNVTVLDSVGCGDALAGAFLAIYTLTMDADRAVESGIRAAVEIAQMPGCNPPNKKLLDLLDGETVCT